MRKIGICFVLLFLSACGFKTPNEAGSTGGTAFTNFSTQTTISGNLATSVKPVGGFISSIGNPDATTFTTSADRGSFITTTQLVTTVGTAVTFETVKDVTSNLVVGQLLRAGNTTSLVTAVLSLTP